MAFTLPRPEGLDPELLQHVFVILLSGPVLRLGYAGRIRGGRRLCVAVADGDKDGEPDRETAGPSE